MDKSEFERIKAQEKEHLRKMRALKQQYRGVSRQKKVLDALNAMQRTDLDATYEESMRHLTEEAATTEARLEIAMEDAGVTPPNPEALSEADREKLRQSEAAALIRQMKAEMGTPLSEVSPSPKSSVASDAASFDEANVAERTIGRTPANSTEPRRDDPQDPKATTPDKSIGRHRGD